MHALQGVSAAEQLSGSTQDEKVSSRRSSFFPAWVTNYDRFFLGGRIRKLLPGGFALAMGATLVKFASHPQTWNLTESPRHCDVGLWPTPNYSFVTASFVRTRRFCDLTCLKPGPRSAVFVCFRGNHFRIGPRKCHLTCLLSLRKVACPLNSHCRWPSCFVRQFRVVDQWRRATRFGNSSGGCFSGPRPRLF